MHKASFQNKLISLVLILFSALLGSCEIVVTRHSVVLSEDGLRQLRVEILKELNNVRRDPHGYAERVLRPRLRYYHGRGYYPPELPDGTYFFSHEGRYAVDDCIKALLDTPPLPPFTLNTDLTTVAQAFADEQAKTGTQGHIGLNHTTLKDRLKTIGYKEGIYSETNSYGITQAQEIVRQLLIDDNVPNRGHRRTILNPHLRVVGIGFANSTISEYSPVCVIDYLPESAFEP